MVSQPLPHPTARGAQVPLPGMATALAHPPASCWGFLSPTPHLDIWGISFPDRGAWDPSGALAEAVMLPLLLLPLLWGGSLQEKAGYELRVQKSVTVQEGLCVLVPCSFSYPRHSWYYPDELYVYWFRDRENIYHGVPVATNNPHRTMKQETQGRFHLLGDVRKNVCSLRIEDARMEDTGSYFFRMERGSVKYSYEDNKLHLEVTALTEKPDVHFLEPLESGRPARLNCSLPGSCEVRRPLTFSWVGGALSPLHPETTRSPVLTFTPRPEDHGTNLTCQVKLQGAEVTTERTVQLNVSSRQILSTGMSLPILEGQSLFLICTVDSNPHASLSWFREGKALNPSQTSVSGTLELPDIGARDGGEFTCQAQHPLGTQHLSFILSVQRSPSSCMCVTEKQDGSWPLVLTLIRGALMGAGFLLTYGLTWIYYTSCRFNQLQMESTLFLGYAGSATTEDQFFVSAASARPASRPEHPHLRSGVQDQPGRYGETLSLLKTNKQIAGCGGAGL
uniref:sialic acid-binding Ig-like lectin 14 isoform X3 n=1 Tax=Callithrix jacchus TaxID=9483 RepID=UPI0023DD334A|nr:sialic acid-binding Ig-like lectin 14 isoform X3 [Callithrix jacchus]